MANTLTNLTADLYVALDVVSRELTGFIPAVTLDPQVSRAAKNQTVRSFVAPAATASDVTPGVTPPDDGNQTIGNTSVSITKVRRVPFRWSGEEELAMDNNGPGVLNIRQNQIAQAIRTLVNEMEVDLAALYVNASRAYGTAGTTPFASDLTGIAQARKILVDNGAPTSDLQLVIDTAAGAALRTLGQLTKANEAGNDTLLRQGVLLDLEGFKVRESAAVKKPAIGTGTGYLVNNGGGYAAGTTAITVDTGSGTIVAGDVITVGSDTNKYVVATALAANVVTIAAPGLLQACSDNDAITVVAAARRNCAFSRNALILSTRLPARPKDGDLAKDYMTITDPRTGLSFEIAMYPQYRQMQYEISVAWGTASTKTEHQALLLG